MVIYQFYNMSSLEMEKSEFKSFPLPIFAVSESPKRAPLYVEIDIEDMLFRREKYDSLKGKALRYFTYLSIYLSTYLPIYNLRSLNFLSLNLAYTTLTQLNYYDGSYAGHEN